LFIGRGKIDFMPKRKTADASVEAAAVPEKKRKSSAKPTAPAAATHKRTPRKAKAEVATIAALRVESTVENSVPAAIAAPAPVPEAVTLPRIPTTEEIATLAYSYWEQRGYQGGFPEQDWYRAERELLKLAQDR
jgi:hypothetical protein